MKYLKPYNNINESVKDFLKPKSEDDIKKSLKLLSPTERLFKGCEFGLIDVVKQSIEDGADINFDSGAALLNAMENSSNDIIEYLINNGIDIKPRAYGFLVICCLLNNTKVAKMLLEKNILNYISNTEIITLIKYYDNGVSKLIKKYSNTNESIRDFLKPKSNEDILKSLDELTPYDKVKKILNYRKYHKDNVISDDIFNNIIKELKPNEKLILGCSNGWYWLVKMALDEGANSTQALNVPIKIADQNGHMNIVELLLKYDDVRKMLTKDQIDDYEKRIELSKLFKQNESIKDSLKPKSNEEIQKLIKKSVDEHINKKGKINYKIFIESCKMGIINSVLYCLQNDPTNEIDQSTINYGLSTSSYYGHLDIVKYLIEEKDADIHDRNDFAFRNACEGGYVEMVKYLIDKGANIYVNNSEYLKWRLKGLPYHDPNKEEILKILEERDKLNRLNKTNESVKDFLKPKSKEDIVKSLEKLSLIDKLYRIGTYNMWNLYSEDDIKNMFKRLKPQDKIIQGTINNVTWLLKEGIDEGGDPSCDLNFPIRISCSDGYTDIVKILLQDKRVDPSCDNNAPIRLSSYYGHIDIVKLLLHDERVDPCDVRFESVIWSIKMKHFNITKLLISDKRVIDKMSKEYLYNIKQQIELNSTNESVKDFLKPKSKEDIVKSLEKLPICIRLQKSLDNNILTEDEVRKEINNLPLEQMEEIWLFRMLRKYISEEKNIYLFPNIYKIYDIMISLPIWNDKKLDETYIISEMGYNTFSMYFDFYIKSKKGVTKFMIGENIKKREVFVNVGNKTTYFENIKDLFLFLYKDPNIPLSIKNYFLNIE